MSHPCIYLQKNEDKRLRKGHVWVFSNEIDTVRSQLNTITPGEPVNIMTAEGKTMGTAYFNPHTLIAARLLSRKPNLKINTKFFKSRLMAALTLRERLFDQPYYRLVYGESDGLPGLVIDRFGAVLSVQMTTAGIEHHKNELITALLDLLQPETIIFKNDSQQRDLEGLGLEAEIAHGSIPEPLIIEENNTLFKIDSLKGQKTGWFYDHRYSRSRLAKLCRDRTVLDLFSYTGAWGVLAANSAAAEVTCVDSSEQALALAADNALLNKVENRMQFLKSDVFDFLKQARQNNQLFDTVILDPPALIKRKKDFKQGFEAYRRLNHLALQVLAPNGILVSASCSYHLSRSNLHEILRSSARHIDRHMVFFATDGQGPDHPIHPAVPETDYLKTFFCTVSPSL